jgi:hypothetical protein
LANNAAGQTIWSEGSGSFTATADDSGLPSSNSGDKFAITFTRKGQTTPYKSFVLTQLAGGNIVIHMK